MIVSAYALWIDNNRNIKSVHVDYAAAHKAWREGGRDHRSSCGPIKVHSCIFLEQIMKEGFARIDAAIEEVLNKY